MKFDRISAASNKDLDRRPQRLGLLSKERESRAPRLSMRLKALRASPSGATATAGKRRKVHAWLSLGEDYSTSSPSTRERVRQGVASSLVALTLSFAGCAHCGTLDQPSPSLVTSPHHQHHHQQQQKLHAVQVGLFEPQIERDPVEPFTLYGDIVKKFFIENLDETGKIVSRRKGFTTTVCINAVEQSKETPQVIGLPQQAKVDSFGGPTCVEVIGQDFEKTCDKACARGCEEQIRAYLNKLDAETGFKLEPGEPRRILISCSKRCFKESMRPGNNRPFSVTWLR